VRHQLLHETECLRLHEATSEAGFPLVLCERLDREARLSIHRLEQPRPKVWDALRRPTLSTVARLGAALATKLAQRVARGAEPRMALPEELLLDGTALLLILDEEAPRTQILSRRRLCYLPVRTHPPLFALESLALLLHKLGENQDPPSLDERLRGTLGNPFHVGLNRRDPGERRLALGLHEIYCRCLAFEGGYTSPAEPLAALRDLCGRRS
jgi:hypothetical protein